MSNGGVSYVVDAGEQDLIHVTATATASGDTVLYTPASGKRLRVRWVYAVNNPAASSSPLIKISLGSAEIFRVYALSKRQLVTGPVDGALKINLSAAAEVAVTVLLEEI